MRRRCFAMKPVLFAQSEEDRHGLEAIGIGAPRTGDAAGRTGSGLGTESAGAVAWSEGARTAPAAPLPAEHAEYPPLKGIDLPTALRLAGVYNPEIQLARERVVEAVAMRQLATAQLLPTVNSGMDINHHQGALQQSSGTILKVDRDSLYVGLGAATVGSGTVNIPGIYWNANVSNVYFDILVSRQTVRQRGFASDAVRNDVLLQVASAYMELLRATGGELWRP